MNIAFITTEYTTEAGFDGGLANYLRNTCGALARRGHNIYVIVASDKNEVIRDGEVSVVRVVTRSKLVRVVGRIFGARVSDVVKWLVQSWRLSRRLNLLCGEEGIDIAQYSSYTATGFFRDSAIPSLVRISSYQPALDKVNGLEVGLFRKFQYRLELIAMKRADGVFGPSYLIAGAVERVLKKSVEIVESPVEMSMEGNASIYSDLLSGKKYLLFFGSLSILKGVKEIADILPELLSKYPDLRFVFVGKNFLYRGKPMMDYVWKMAGGYRGRCIYVGSVRKEFLAPIIDHAEALVLPSRIDNFPNTCLEGMVRGKIVIGTKGSSFEQIIEDGQNGYLCENSDPASLLEAIIKVVNLDGKKRLDIEAKAEVRMQTFNPEVIACKLENLYNGIIEGRRE